MFSNDIEDKLNGVVEKNKNVANPFTHKVGLATSGK